MTTLLYFAYGSNMSTARIGNRLRSVKPVATAALCAHVLKFHKVGRDRSAKCDIVPTGNSADLVHGVVFELQAADKAILDRIEGLGNDYLEKPVSLASACGNLQAVSYYAARIDPSLRPFHWYKEHVVRGAREHRLPYAHIRLIELVASVTDPDWRRHARELAIYT